MLLSTAGFVTPGGPGVGRGPVIERAPARMLLEPNALFLLSKLDLSQFRQEREALDSVINEIDERIVGAAVPGPAEQQAALNAVDAVSAAGDGFGPAALLSGLLQPIAPLLPIPAVAVPAAALYYLLAWPLSPTGAADGSSDDRSRRPSSKTQLEPGWAPRLTEQGAAVAKARPPGHPPPPSPATLLARPLTRASRVSLAGCRSRSCGAAQGMARRPELGGRGG